MRRSGLGSARPLAERRVSRMVSCAVWAGLCSLLLAACSLSGSVKPTVKIGLAAPFEGLYRDLGYEALHAVRLAVRERNAEGGVGQCYLVELVALAFIAWNALFMIQYRFGFVSLEDPLTFREIVLDRFTLPLHLLLRLLK